jgi:hypothetical protein
MNPQPSDDLVGVLKTGLADLYKSLVIIAFYRADVVGSSIAEECGDAGVNVVLEHLPPSVQLAMYNSLDGGFASEITLHGEPIDNGGGEGVYRYIRHRVPDGVIVNPDETIVFPPDYNIGVDGFPVGMAAKDKKLIPLPPAFRPNP